METCEEPVAVPEKKQDEDTASNVRCDAGTAADSAAEAIFSARAAGRNCENVCAMQYSLFF
jgi:hypothetical protein